MRAAHDLDQFDPPASLGQRSGRKESVTAVVSPADEHEDTLCRHPVRYDVTDGSTQEQFCATAWAATFMRSCPGWASNHLCSAARMAPAVQTIAMTIPPTPMGFSLRTDSHSTTVGRLSRQGASGRSHVATQRPLGQRPGPHRTQVVADARPPLSPLADHHGHCNPSVVTERKVHLRHPVFRGPSRQGSAQFKPWDPAIGDHFAVLPGQPVPPAQCLVQGFLGGKSGSLGA